MVSKKIETIGLIQNSYETHMIDPNHSRVCELIEAKHE
jgi:hypothetical protein